MVNPTFTLSSLLAACLHKDEGQVIVVQRHHLIHASDSFFHGIFTLISHASFVYIYFNHCTHTTLLFHSYFVLTSYRSNFSFCFHLHKSQPWHAKLWFLHSFQYNKQEVAQSKNLPRNFHAKMTFSHSLFPPYLVSYDEVLNGGNINADVASYWC
jgi:hypothetical protein